MKNALLLTILACLTAINISACNYQASTDQIEKWQQEKTTRQAAVQVGMPNIVNFTEKRFAKKIYELRDDKIRTYTYIVDMNGKQHFMCNSIGYGLPYATQYTNPEKRVNNSDEYGYNITQAEPNGLYMPSSAEGTWVACVDSDGNIQPVYTEPRIIVSPFKLHIQ